MKKTITIVITVMAAIIAAALAAFVLFAYPRYVQPYNIYKSAERFEREGDSLRAALCFESIPSYRDSQDRARQAWVKIGDERYNEGDFEFAYSCYVKAGADQERMASLDEAFFRLGKDAYESRLGSAEIYFDSIESDEYDVRKDEVRIASGAEYVYANEYEQAKSIFALCSADTTDRIAEIWFRQGEVCLEQFELERAFYCFSEARKTVSDDKLTDLLGRINQKWSDAMLDALLSNNAELADAFGKYGSMFEEDSVLAERDRLRYEEAVAAFDSGDFQRALILLKTVSEGYENADEMIEFIRAKLKNAPAAGGTELGAVLELDGSIRLLGSGWQISSPNWANIDSIAVGKDAFILGVRTNGTVVAKGISSYNRTNVGDWKNIVAVACGQYHSLGLTGNGRVVSCGWNYYGQGLTSQWNDVVAVACGSQTSYGLTKNGRVLAAGDSSLGQLNVGSWRDIVAIAAGTQHVVGVMKDGSVVATGSNDRGQCNVSGWQNIVSAAAGENHTVGLLEDGTLVAVGDNTYGQCNVSGYSGVVAIAAGGGFTVIVFDNGEYTVIGNISNGDSVSMGE